MPVLLVDPEVPSKGEEYPVKNGNSSSDARAIWDPRSSK